MRPGTPFSLSLLSLLALCSLCAAGCTMGARDQEATRNWPPRPHATRIVWTGAAKSPENLEIGNGFWARLWRDISGDNPDTIARPYGIHADCRRRILVVDSQKKGVHLYDREFKRYYFVGGKEFTLPIGVTEDEHNTAFVTDSAAGAVYRFNLGERRVTPFVTGLQRPTGIVFNPLNQMIYVTDTLAGQVLAFDGQGKEVFRFGRPGKGRGEFNLPTDLAVDLKGRIYVTDPLNARIQVFTRDGAYLREFGQAGDTPGYFGKPKGVAVNSEGHVYVCDAQYDRVQVFNQEGKLLISFGSTGNGKGEFWMPSGIAIDKDDNIFVADSYNNRIQLFGYIWLD
ncbi:6-bladed beta-propeller [Geomonas propionica]|nr:6-bladed beta-propeller [Geomonas propionica]